MATATADDILKIAAAEIGTTEYPANSNRTKYGQDYGWNGVAWCVIFQWWIFAQAHAQGLFYGGQKCASCSQLKKYAEKVGRWVTGGYRKGDLVIMDFPNNNTETDHVGIVESVNGTVLITIEGNTSPDDGGSQYNGGAVCRKRRDTRTVKIVGAYRPNYKEDDMTGKEIYDKLQEYLSAQTVPDWAKAELQEAIDAGVTDGTNPMQLIPRYQAAIMAKRAIK